MLGLKLPIADSTSNGGISTASQTIVGEKLFQNGIVIPGFNLPATTVTVVSNAFTKVAGVNQISTGSGAVVVNNINGGIHGDVIVLRTTTNANPATITAAGNIVLQNNMSCVLDTSGKTMVLIYSGSAWLEVARSPVVTAGASNYGTVPRFVDWTNSPTSFAAGGTALTIIEYRYQRIGKTVNFQIYIDANAGGGTSSSDITVTLPITARSGTRPIGTFVYRSSGGAAAAGTGSVMITSTTQFKFYRTTNPSSVSATSPLVGTNLTSTNGYIRATGCYEAAT